MRADFSSGLVLGAALLMATASLPAIAQAPAPAAQAVGPVAQDDAIPTARGSLIVHPIVHAAVMLTWNGKKILVDPAPAASRGPLPPELMASFTALGTPDLILITHAHGDHFNVPILTAVAGSNTVFGVPKLVYDGLPDALKAKATVMVNGDKATLAGIPVEAVPSYNTTPERQRYHPQGAGNGYILTLGGKRVYLAGDTEEAPELKNLPNIDVAFIPMVLPFTQTQEAAAQWVKDFKPKIVYPYHYSNADLTPFVQAVGNASEVRLRKWY